MRFSLPLLLVVVALTSCSGPSAGTAVQYDASRGVTTFRSQSISLGDPVQGGAMGAARILLSAKAECRGKGCAPAAYDVSLVKSGGNSAVADYNQITFETRDGTVSFGDGLDADGRAQFYSVMQGEFVRLTVPDHIFQSFAESPTLTIRLGGQTYRLDYERRSALRRLLPAETAAH